MTDPAGPDDPLLMHATAVAIGGAGVMICGKSGAGKSDLALRLIDRGATLISDDYVELRSAGDALTLTPPSRLAGKLEVRSLGIVVRDFLTDIPLQLVVKLTPRPERFPMDRPTMILLGKTIPCCTLDAMENSATIKTELALRACRPDTGDR